MRDLSSLQQPKMEYRTRNYWGWLENITPEETVWQIDQMYNAGLGGYVMHARGGLTMPYAGQQWMDSVRAMVRRGQELGMVTIVDDEHGWPSGFGAGKVNGKGEAYQLKYLLCEELDAQSVQNDPCTLGLWTKDYAFVADASLLPGDTKLIRVYKKIDKYYVDNMDPKVVDAFIEASYEDYWENLNRSFEGVYGIFSDEPQTARYATPWSDILPDLYQNKYHTDLLPELVKLFYPVSGCEKLRVELYGLMQQCFTENYAGKLQKWCESHGAAFTGHTCLEDDMVGQLRCAIDTMPFYENMTVPGIDWLCRIPLSNLTILQLTSAAQQVGKKRVLCEMFGCAGWNVSLEEMKWIAQWQAALGINDHLQHLGLYSLRGSRKREYPASLHYQQPWFPKYRPYNDYFARVSQLLCESTLETDLLVIHPMRAAWARYDGSDHSCDEIQNMILTLLNDLLQLSLSPHLGSEALMEKHGRVEGKELVIGQCRYKTVLLPPMDTLSANTVRLLAEFAANGGRLVCAHRLPHMVDGVETKVDLPCEYIDLTRDALKKAFPSPVCVENGTNLPVYIARWNWDDQKFLYLTNNDLHTAADVAVKAEGCWYEYDPLTNTLAAQPTDLARIHLEGAQAMILFAGEDAPVKAAEAPYAHSLTLDGKWALTSATANALTLDHCCLSFDGKIWEEEAYILDIQKRLLTESLNRDVYLRFTFRSQAAMDMLLLVENPEKCRITVNGHVISSVSTGWRVDKCLETLPISCVEGENEIIVQRLFTNSDRVYFVKNNDIHEAEANRVTVETELEAIYLWGDFAVRNLAEETDAARRTTATLGDFVLAPLPGEVCLARLEKDGFPFFAGTITADKTFSLEKKPARARLRFARPDAIVTAVYVNGEKVQDFCWAPYEADITDLLRDGENTVRVEVTNSCRNLFGPHYSRDGENYGVGPFSYSKEVPQKHFVRFGVESGMIIDFE